MLPFLCSKDYDNNTMNLVRWCNHYNVTLYNRVTTNTLHSTVEIKKIIQLSMLKMISRIIFLRYSQKRPKSLFASTKWLRPRPGDWRKVTNGKFKRVHSFIHMHCTHYKYFVGNVHGICKAWQLCTKLEEFIRVCCKTPLIFLCDSVCSTLCVYVGYKCTFFK